MQILLLYLNYVSNKCLNTEDFYTYTCYDSVT